MRLTLLFVSTVLLAGPALAQTADPTLPAGVSETQQGTPAGIPAAPGLPGVGLDPAADSAADSQAGQPKGPGGLQNGVGGEGTLAPSTTGSNDDIVDQDTSDDSGVPVVK
jgi:hypothetical protein